MFLNGTEYFLADISFGFFILISLSSYISFVGAPSSPFGSSIIFHGTKAPDQLETKINKNIVPMYGTHFRYSFSPIWFFAMSLMNSVTNSIKDCPDSGTNFNCCVVSKLMPTIIKITIQEFINT